MRKWEYQTIVRDLEYPFGDNELNKLGENGWELVNEMIEDEFFDQEEQRFIKHCYVYRFKRRKT